MVVEMVVEWVVIIEVVTLILTRMILSQGSKGVGDQKAGSVFARGNPNTLNFHLFEGI